MPRRSESRERELPFQAVNATRGPLPASELSPSGVSLDQNFYAMYTPPRVLALCFYKHNGIEYSCGQVKCQTTGLMEGITLCKFQHNAEGYTVFIGNFWTETY